MGDLEAKTISKQEDKDEIRRILAYVYLVKQKVVLFSAFPRSFWLSVSSTILLNTAMATPRACWVGVSGPGYAIAIHRGHGDSTEGPTIQQLVIGV